MNDRYRQARKYWVRHSLFNNRLSYKMLIWGMRRAKVKPEVVLDDYERISGSARRLSR